MKHLYLLFIFFCLILSQALAQANYKAGYIVSLTGDTTRGYVDYKEWDLNPEKVTFKDASGTEKRFTPADISNFGVNGWEYYKSAVVKVSQGEVNVTKLALTPDTIFILDTVFLKIETAGDKVTLYSYQDRIKERYYIGEGNAEPLELIYNVYLDELKGLKTIQATYKRQLQKLAATYQPDNSSLLQKIQNTNYKLTDLKSTVKKINNTENIRYTSDDKSAIRFYAGAGVSYSLFKFSAEGIYANGESKSYVQPKINAGIDIYLNKNVGKLIFRNEISFTKNKGEYVFSGVSNTPYDGVLNFSQYLISYNPQLLYSFYNTQKLKLYFNFGAAISYASYNNKKEVITYHTGNGDIVNNSLDFPGFESKFFNISTGIGTVISDKINIHAGYIPSTSINASKNSIKYSAFQISVNYLFGKK